MSKKVKVVRASDGDSKEVHKSEVKKYSSLGYRIEASSTEEVKAKVTKVKKDDTKEGE